MAVLRLIRLAPSREAMCADGSGPAYYLKEGDSDVILVWLEGGGDCGTKDVCDERFQRQYRMSSLHLSPLKVLDGIFSDSTSNVFARATRIYVPYCSSDSWLGRNLQPVYGYYFQGAAILSRIVEALEPQLLSARLAVFGGCSAGGRGAFYNLDRLCGLLPNRSTRCRGLLDAAWWVPDGPAADGLGRLVEGARAGVQSWGAELGECGRQQGNNSYMCMFGPVWAPYVSTPYLMHEEQFDDFQLWKRGVARPVFTWLPHAWQIAVALSHQLRASLAVIADSEGRSARVGPVVFSGTCTEHCLAESAGYWRVKVHGRSMEELARDWLEDGFASSLIERCWMPNCSSGCPFEPLLYQVLLAIAAFLLIVTCTCCLCWRSYSHWRAQRACRVRRPHPGAYANLWQVIGARDPSDSNSG
ncbi:Palmitoleoyl-protein carboxylesterase notum2 [Durusdinium trenchii]|uniref:Palmitoleoyl-protein carboxylesterase notum2 n=1 Tax=Durusdinium trenchii TaxID=1381693 RepID=A0ABP0S7C0_9DINO